MQSANLSLGILTGLVLAALSACTTPYGWNKAAGNQIDQTLEQAKQNAARDKLPSDVSQALLPPLQINLPEGSVTPLEPRFDLTVNNAPARQVFMSLVQGTRYGMVVHPDVGGAVSLNLKDVTVAEAMDTLRKVYGYEYRREGNRFLVLARGMQTRLFPVNYLNLQRKGRSGLRVNSGELTKGGTTGATSQTADSSSIQIETQSQSDFWKELESTIKTLIGADAGRKVVANPHSGLLVVRALPDELRVVEEYLGSTQINLNRQVVLEAKILEVELNDAFQTGINWARLGTVRGASVVAGQTGGGTMLPGFSPSDTAAGATGNLNPTTGIFSAISGTDASAFGGVFSLAIRSTNFAAFVELLQTQGRVHVLSSPRVSTVNNQKAVIKVGGDEFFVTGVTSGVTTVGTTTVSTPSVELTPFFSGIALDVTPQIDDDNNIVLHIHPSVSEVVQKNKSFSVSGQAFSLPLALSSIQESDNIVRAGSSQIIVIGGLMKEGSTDENASIPFLGDIPLLGNLFKHKRVTRIKKELVILLKPTVVTSGQAWNEMVQESQEHIKKMKR